MAMNSYICMAIAMESTYIYMILYSYVPFW